MTDTDLERSEYLDELSRKVARIHGKWREVHKEEWPLYFRSIPEGMTELWMQGTNENFQCRGCPPNYAKSLDQAIELLEGLDWSMEMYWPDAEYRCNIGRIREQCCFECCGGCDTFRASADAPTLPEAICQAWIHYKTEKQNG